MAELSFSRGPHAPLLEHTISEALFAVAERLPHHDALVVRHQNTRLTYHQLHERVEATARGLAGLGLKPGDRTGVWASGCLEWVLLFLACARAGLVQVNGTQRVRPKSRSAPIRCCWRARRCWSGSISEAVVRDHHPVSRNSSEQLE